MSSSNLEQMPSGSSNDNSDNNNNHNCSRLTSIRNYKLPNWFPHVSFVYPLIFPLLSIHSVFDSHFYLLDNFHTAPSVGFHSWQIKLKCSLFGNICTMTWKQYTVTKWGTESFVVAGGREKYPAMGYWLPTETQTSPEAGSSFIQNLYFN